MKNKTIVEQCPICKQQIKRRYFKDTSGRTLSCLVRHLKDGKVCIRGSMTLIDLMKGFDNQYIGDTNEQEQMQ